MVQSGRTHFGSYVQTAFAARWNLLFFGGAVAFALLSGRFDIWGPLAAAGELAYLVGLASHPKFQAYVDAQAAKEARAASTVDSDRSLRTILQALPRRSLERFEQLRTRCRELRQLALEIKDPQRAIAPQPLEQMQMAGLDRLLWIYLRLLYTEYSLERFLDKTSADQIEKDIADLEGRLKQVATLPDELQRQRMQKTIEDNLQTCRDRLANQAKARANYQLVQLEIDRLENKIRAVSELAVNRQEPDFITTQVDQVATSLVQTERTMNELQFATGLEVADEAAPELLERGTVQTTH